MQSKVPFDFQKRACEAMREEGFVIDFPPEVMAEVNGSSNHSPAVDNDPSVRDLRNILWSSIDNTESKDLDQVEFAEALPNGCIRVFVGIADVDALVPRKTATDSFARRNCTSVYTGGVPFPMLPPQLSNDLSSLRQDADRLALVSEFVIDDCGEVNSTTAYRAKIRNAAKLTYDEVGNWLDGRNPVPEKISSVPGLIEQLQLQKKASDRLMAFRQRQGALTLGGLETTPVVRDNEVKEFAVLHPNSARQIIESFMVASNVAMAEALNSKGSLSIRRVVRTPKRWDRICEIAAQYGEKFPVEPDPKPLNEFLRKRRETDPIHYPDLSLTILKLLGAGEYVVGVPGKLQEGHFGLAVHDYTHSTAPNRRYADLITQRLLKGAVTGKPNPYTEQELSEVAAHCTERDSAARHVERLMRKICAAAMLRDRIGEVFDGIITGVADKGTFVRLLGNPAEGRVNRGQQGLDVGDKVRVRLLSVDLQKGYIDFEAIK